VREAADRAPRARLVWLSVLASLWFALVFFVALPAAVLGLAGRSLRPPAGAPLALGLCLVALAHAALLPQVAAFVRQGDGTHAPFAPPRHLVARGVYGRVRNPMYLLYTVVMAGEALAYRSLALAAYTAGFWLAAHLYVVGVEEPGLRRRFGAVYEAYCRETGRWLPRRRRVSREAPRSP
jgi:protein-S-isoprenylcysteine O-methyltransferase Ste14